MSHQLQYTHPPEEQPDSWHLHTMDEGTPQQEHASSTNAAMLAGAFIGSFLFVGLVILVSYLYFQVIAVQKREERIETTVLGADARAYKADALASLQTYSFPNEQAARAGVVQLPLAQAEQRVLAQYKSAGAAGGSK
jgi:hypothetical protein